jgi:hypothetical protein
MNPELTQELKSIIVNKGLVDTGRLRDSIKVDVRSNESTIQVDVTAEDYLKYLIEDYNIIQEFTNSQKFSQEIQKILEPLLAVQVEKALFSTEEIKIPRVFLTINGQ